MIEECDSTNVLLKEQYYINYYNSYNNGYNGRPIAENNLGLIISEKTKNKLKENNNRKREKKYELVSNLYLEGKTTRDISNELKMSRETIKKILNECNISIRKDFGLEKVKIYNSYSQELLLYLTYYKVLHTAIYDKKLIFDKNLIYDSINYFEKFEEYENCDYIKKYL